MVVRAAVGLLVASIAVAEHSGGAPCSTDEGCQLNGRCELIDISPPNGRCRCAPEWTGADCGLLSLEPARLSPHAGYDEPGTSSWGGSILADPGGELYHMFASRFEDHCGLNAWQQASTIIHATSNDPVGPYTYNATIMGVFSHGPSVRKTRAGYMMMHLGCGVPYVPPFSDCTGGITPKGHGSAGFKGNVTHACTEFNVSVMTAASLRGPWSASTPVLLHSAWSRGLDQKNHFSNPAPLVMPDGTFRVAFRSAPEVMTEGHGGEFVSIATSTRMDGPYIDLRTQPALEGAAEDPFVWQDERGHWHLLVHNMGPPFVLCPPSRPCPPFPRLPEQVARHAFSRSVDGPWTSSATAPYSLLITFSDGSQKNMTRRERPQLLLSDKGQPRYFSTGVQDTADHTYTRVMALKTEAADADQTEQSTTMIKTDDRFGLPPRPGHASGTSASAALAPPAARAAAAGERAAQPHIVFFLADDYGFADCSYHTDMYGAANGTNVIQTPHLDALSGAGVRLERYYIQPVCSPTRATLLTGRYVFHHGIHVPLIDSSSSALPLNETTMAQRLSSAGYATHAIGKWHLGFKSWAHTPQERGFDTFFGYYAGSQDYWNHQSLCWPGTVTNGCFEDESALGEPCTGNDLHRDRAIVNSTEYATTLYTSEAEDVIAAHARAFGRKNGVRTEAAMAGQRAAMSKPLFLYLPHQAVHVGNSPEASHPEYAMDQAPAEYIQRYAWVQDEPRRNLSAMVTVMDVAAGNVTASLKKHGMWQDTVFIFSTDNGGPVGKGASNYPLRGGKGSLWEGGVRGIGFVAGGDLAAWGVAHLPKTSHSLIHVSDWLPTVCELAGGCPLPSKQPLDGVSAWGSIARGHPNSTESNRTEIVHDLCQQWMGGSCLERLAPNPDAPGALFASMVRGAYKIVVGQGQTGNFTPKLFDVLRDPSETTDLAHTAEGAPVVEELMKALLKHALTAGVAHDRDPIDKGSNPRLHGGNWMPWLGERA